MILLTVTFMFANTKNVSAKVTIKNQNQLQRERTIQ